MNRRIAVRAVIYQNSKIFALRQIKQGVVNEFWSTPGGGLDPMESLEDGLTRELIEETGVKPAIGRLLFIQQYRESETEEQLEFFYHVTNADDFKTLDLSKTTHGELEISDYDFIDPKEAPLLPDFLKSVDIEAAINSGKPAIFTYL